MSAFSIDKWEKLNQIIVGSNTEVEVVVYRNGVYLTLKLIF